MTQANSHQEALDRIKSGQMQGRLAMSALVDALRHEGSLDLPIFENATALGWACRRQNVELVAALLDAGALPDGLAEGVATDRIPPLASAMCAMQGPGGRACAELLYSAGASVNRVDAAGIRPLHYAVMFSQGIDGIEWLLSKGADPNKPGKDGLSPLHVAAGLQNINAVKALIGAGADPRALAECSVLGFELDQPKKLMSSLDLAAHIMPEGGPMLNLMRLAGQALDDCEDLDESIQIPKRLALGKRRI